MNWTTAKPKSAGWYWRRNDRDHEPHPVRIYSVGDITYAWPVDNSPQPNVTVRLADCPGQWAGPLHAELVMELEDRLKEALGKKLQWTKEAPSVDGYYWLKADRGNSEIRIVHVERGKVRAFGGQLEFFLHRQRWMTDSDWKLCSERKRGYWAGPIEPPA